MDISDLAEDYLIDPKEGMRRLTQKVEIPSSANS
jgi:hypothetical protein